MITAPDYAAAEKQARLENAEQLRANLGADDVALKIFNWAAKYSLEPEFVRYKVLTDDTFALQFVKDPSRQGIHQKVAAAHIGKEVPLVEDFVAPPSAGPNAEYVVRGMVVLGAGLRPATNDHGKSIDFKWAFSRGGHTLRVFATHKHTKEEGGTQDNQFEDVRRFLREASACRDADALFMAICDGDYYQRPYDSRESRLIAMRQDHPGRRSVVGTIADVPRLYADALEAWHAHHGLKVAVEDAEQLAKMRAST